MTRLVKLADDALGEGILIDDDRQLVSQILVPSRYQTDHICGSDHYGHSHRCLQSTNAIDCKSKVLDVARHRSRANLS